ncbi:hypothetical protein Pan216_31260 [Planctomycetes bacterium Pan216]|uniref:Uncharacterized protein n=1 Tax=Kolteria novifilia TaxID=2527975 RepID=A0A518B5L4_9BACT|nr:hypothetical protein Pan216_31260 [Planctomycetes bacterium Pan216]
MGCALSLAPTGVAESDSSVILGPILVLFMLKQKNTGRACTWSQGPLQGIDCFHGK